MFASTELRGTEAPRNCFSTIRSRCLSASVFRIVMFLLWLSPVTAQQLLDRIVARVNGTAITLTDVNAAIALGIVGSSSAIDQLIDRQLVLAEVARFLPPEPPASAVAVEAGSLTTNAGPELAGVMASTGVDEARIREMARENLRIQAYLTQRFGVTPQLTEEEVAQYYRIHPEEFTRSGTLMPFTEAEPLARERAAAERRATTVSNWMRDLRERAEISLSR
jgi:hypothetical protein